MGTYRGHSKPYSALSPLYACPQLQPSVGSWQQEVPTIGLWLHLSVSPRTRLFSGTLCSKEERSQAFVWGSGSHLHHSFWGKSWKVALKNSFASCTPFNSFISWLISSRFLQSDGRIGLDETTGSIPLFILGTRCSDPHHSSKCPVKAFYRYKNMKTTFSSSPSHLPGPRVTKKLYIFSDSLVKRKHPPSPASVWELTGKTKELSKLKNLSKQSTMSLVMKNLAKRSTVLITFTVKNTVRS